MASPYPEIVRCPPQYVNEAIALVLCDIAPSQRPQIAAPLWGPSVETAAGEGLFVALRGGEVCGAVWGQLQPGNTSVLWPPQLVTGENPQTGLRLAECAVRQLDRIKVRMTQVLLPAQDNTYTAVLNAVGFSHLADLLYLTCEAERFAVKAPHECSLSFEPYDPAQRGRLAELIEQTYENTLDCVALNGARSIDEVIDGYQATGTFCAENWRIARHDDADVGVLLLADHPQARHWELVYMGLVPEARGKRWGIQITQHAQALAARAQAERIVLAVDAANVPALRMYRAVGFESWDRRAVYVRLCH